MRYLMAKPIEGDELSSGILAGNFEKHCTHKRHSSVDGRAAECISGREKNNAGANPTKLFTPQDKFKNLS